MALIRAIDGPLPDTHSCFDAIAMIGRALPPAGSRMGWRLPIRTPAASTKMVGGDAAGLPRFLASLP